jgi:uncharacterized RDD family membrane protein YckC
MVSAATRVISTNNPQVPEKIIDFSPARLKAPFALRCAALTIDYMLLLLLPVGWLTAAKLFGEPGAIVVGTTAWIIGILLVMVNFLLLPLLRGQTVGKMMTGLTILNIDGTDIGFGTVLRRNVLGYLVTVLTLGLGFLISAVNSSGRALHDFTAGTIVVRGSKKQL